MSSRLRSPTTSTRSQQSGLINAGWQKRLPQNSAPYTSTIVFLVRKGNPKGIKDWSDLVKPGVGVITPNPKTSGGARWNYLAAWEYAQAAGRAATTRRRREFVTDALQATCRCSIPARAARRRRSSSAASATSCWRGRTKRTSRWRRRKDQIEIVVPSISILAEPPVAVVDKVVDRKGTRAVAEAYLQFLYTPEGQEIAAKHHYRPRDQKVAAKYASTLREREAVHDRRSVRRLAERAEDALRRRRHLRSDLQARPQVR